MANEFSCKVEGQPYWGCTNKREVDVYFALPDDEIINEKGTPGICFIAAGFGGEATASVYQKMRREFADKWNLVTIQCDFMGYRYMGKALQNELDAYNEIFQKKPETFLDFEKIMRSSKNPSGFEIAVESKLCKDETKDDFCEMGIFQVMDCLRSVKSVMEMLDNIDVGHDKRRVIGYGFSHGGYLVHMMNAICPNLFSGIIDNSAWLLPEYLKSARHLNRYFQIKVADALFLGKISIQQQFHASEWIEDLEIYDLRIVSDGLENDAKIIAVHGTEDTLVTVDDKKRFLDRLKHVSLKLVDRENVDGEIYKSATHGVGADFLKLFDKIYNECDLSRFECKDYWQAREIVTEKFVYHVDVSNGLLTLNRNSR